MPRAAIAAFLLMAIGCGTNSSSASDGGAPTCVPNNGVYTCLGGSWPACPALITGPCKVEPTCMGCGPPGPTGVGAGFTCECEGGVTYDGSPGLSWGCVGTEYTCR
jgi:hypothetical protein